jgi:hypothetical protein
LLPYLPTFHHGNSNTASKLSRDLPEVSGKNTYTHTNPSRVIAAKKYIVPAVVMPTNISGTALELPYWFTKWNAMAMEPPRARRRRGKISALMRYWIEFQPRRKRLVKRVILREEKRKKTHP